MRELSNAFRRNACRRARFLAGRLAIALLLVMIVPFALQAAPPNIGNIVPRGIQTGATTTLVVTGSNLAANARLLVPWSPVPLAAKPGGAANRVEFEVAAPQEFPPGIALLWVATAGGVSNGHLAAIDALPQPALAAKEGEPLALPPGPLALTGNLSGSAVDRFSLTGKKGERLVLLVQARRLGANFNPVLRLYDSRGAQLAYSQMVTRYAGDAHLEAILPADGPYTVELHDLAYRAAGPAFYRLAVGDLAVADFALPAGAQAGVAGERALLGPGLTAEAKAKAHFGAETVPGLFPSPLPLLPRLTGSAPVLVVSGHSELLEAPRRGGAPLQELSAVPVAVSGVIAAAGEEDKYLLPVTAGQKLRIEVFASRLGSRLDAACAVQNEQGGQLAAGDDSPGSTDASLEVAVPGGVTKVVLGVRDHQRQGGPDFVYRLQVREASAPSVILDCEQAAINVPAGGTELVRMNATRFNYGGPIRLEFANLPPGISAVGEIGADSALGLISFSAAAGSQGAGRVAVVGRGEPSALGVASPLRAADFPGSGMQPWLRHELPVAAAEPARLALEWVAPPAEGEKLTLGGTYAAKLKLSRSAGVSGAVRLKLVTTQPPLKKKVKKNDKEEEVDDEDQMLRLLPPLELPADAAELAAEIKVPANLPERRWGFSVVAELLSEDKKNVLATAPSPVRYLPAGK